MLVLGSTGYMFVLLNLRERTWEMEVDYEFSFHYVQFVAILKYLGENIQQAFENLSRNMCAKVGAGNINLGVVTSVKVIKMVKKKNGREKTRT